MSGQHTRRDLVALSASLGLAAATPALAAASDGVLELRQYKIVPGKRDEMIALFEREFVEGLEASGMDLVGQFRDLDDPNRFTWIRSFPDMPRRAAALNSFYFGPIWQAHRGEANPLLEDNDNVLLLKPAAPGTGFAAGQRQETPARGGLVVATIHYLWKAPEEGFDRFFLDRVAPELKAAGLPVLGAFVPENAKNTFPQLPVRQGEKLFVWFTRADSAEAYEQAWARLRAKPAWVALETELRGYEERQAQVLRLEATPRSKLR